MVDVFICADDDMMTGLIKTVINERYGKELCVSVFNRGMDLVGAIQLKERIPDILIADTVLRDCEGISLVKELQGEYPHIKVIYVSNTLEYATEIFCTDPMYFLVKPICEEKLREALEKAIKTIEADRSDMVLIKNNGSELLLRKREIIYIESKGRKLLLCLNNGTEISVYDKLDVMQERLGSSFIRCHKSYLVNIKYISERVNQEFLLINGAKIPISKTKLKEVREWFTEYWTGVG